MEDRTKLVKHLAELAMLDFPDEELEEMARDMQDAIGLLDEIKGADVTGIKPKIKTIAFKDLRQDEVKPSYDKEELLRNAQKQHEGAFVVAKVVD